jgi:hypothetical protein
MKTDGAGFSERWCEGQMGTGIDFAGLAPTTFSRSTRFHSYSAPKAHPTNLKTVLRPIRTDRSSRVLFALGASQLRPRTLICTLLFSKSSASFPGLADRIAWLRSLNRLPLPVRHLAGMYAVMRSDFLNGLLLLDRLQRDSCFHLRAEGPPLPRFHFCSLSETAILYLIEWSEFWGALQAFNFSPSIQGSTLGYLSRQQQTCAHQRTRSTKREHRS